MMQASLDMRQILIML